MNAPSPPSINKNRSAGRSCLTAAVLFCGYLVMSAMLLLLPTGFIGPVFAGGGFVLFCVIGMHYFVWGRWLSQLLADQGQREKEASTRPPE